MMAKYEVVPRISLVAREAGRHQSSQLEDSRIQHQPDNFVILASFSDNKQGTISVSEIVSI